MSQGHVQLLNHNELFVQGRCKLFNIIVFSLYLGLITPKEFQQPSLAVEPLNLLLLTAKLYPEVQKRVFN